ncbi:MAG: response regulator [Magnetococcales bacterium]|nr:response regulator [Magnetococcales bacterium]MBF0151048.1 response regulator [Magnetococcales bacterium]MBF0173120.1 response regulator [Magnetococcales bacterium]MBF0173123.1 response regulator [Magnetococcales bacterium]MBF0346228.1 response regulator [Magnetococcales bacterium]
MAASDHILVIDDDPDICQLVGDFFQKNGFQVTTANNGKGLQELLDRMKIDLIVLDLMLPDEDGLVVCRNLRSRSNIPVIILSARGEEMDRIIGLEMGADDYLPKPFHPRELLARVKSVLRRARALPEDACEDDSSAHYRFSGWTLDVPTRQLYTPSGDKIFLSGGEFALLRVFLNHPNRVLTRDQLLTFSHGREIEPYDRTIDMQISRLRRRLRDDPKSPELIKTVRSLGYVFSTRVERTDAKS